MSPAMKPARVALFAAILVGGCSGTSSTELGIRTCMLGMFEKRGHMEVYQPGGTYFVMPFVNTWNTLTISQQNLTMNLSAEEGDRPVPDDITFKTRDGNNVHIDVNVMWRIDPTQAPLVLSTVGKSVDEIKERVVRPLARSVIRDVFNEITSEQYYHVTMKNKMAEKAKVELAAALAPFGVIVDMMQVQGHRFDPAYQAAINAQKQAEADIQALVEQQKAMEVQKQTELEGKRAGWNRKREDAIGAAGQERNDADAYFQTNTNAAKAVLAQAAAEADAVRKEASALNRQGGESYVKMQLAKQLGAKKILIVPTSNVSTMNVNEVMEYLMGNASGKAGGVQGAKPGE
jgi:regulator of protease activity HflC (stomatin/prohibitin superfamily)